MRSLAPNDPLLLEICLDINGKKGNENDDVKLFVFNFFGRMQFDFEFFTNAIAKKKRNLKK